MTLHVRLPRLLRRRRTCPECRRRSRETVCTSCGYPLVTRAREHVPPHM